MRKIIFERRKNRRFRCQTRAVFRKEHSTEEEKGIFYIENLCVDGVFVSGEKAFQLSTVVDLEFCLDENGKVSEGEKVKARGIVTWSNHGTEEPPGMGVKFIEITQGKKAQREYLKKSLGEGLIQEAREKNFKNLSVEGEFYFEKGAYDSAKMALSNALHLHKDPHIESLLEKTNEILDEFEGILERSRLLSQQGKWREAIEDLLRGHTIYPEHESLPFIHADFLENYENYLEWEKQAVRGENSNNLIQAMKYYRLILKISPQDKKIKSKRRWVQFKIMLLLLGIGFIVYYISCLLFV